MPRQTDKYTLALAAASAIVAPNIAQKMTQTELYTTLNRQGFAWNGDCWQPVKPGSIIKTPVQIRLMGLPEVVQETGDDLVAALIARGYTIKSTSKPYPNVEDLTVRVYIVAEPGS
jgi:hypothetical protein